jgi:hypothetical protein
VSTKIVPEMIEIIEIIDDDTEAFGDHTGPRTVHDDRASRRGGPVAAVALVAVIGYGVVASTISSDDTTTHPTPTSVLTTGINNPIKPSSPPARLISPQYYVADPPDGFVMHFAETLGMGGNTAEFTNSASADLWATDDASAKTGSWFVVSRGTHHATGRNSFRTVVDDVEVVIEHDQRSGQKRLSFTKDGNALEITAFHWTDRQLLRLVASVNISDSAIHYANTFFTTDHKRLLDADPTTALFGLPVGWVGYTTAVPAVLAESFTITVAGDTADRAVASRFALTNTTSFAVGELQATIGQSAADPGMSIAQWRDGERLITMRGNLDAGQMMAIAQTARPGQSSLNQRVDIGSPATSEALASELHTVAAGPLADGWGWWIQVSMRRPNDPTSGYLWWIGQPGDSTTPTETRVSLTDAAPSIETFVEHGRTYVLAKVPRSMSGTQLLVSPNGLPSAATSLYDVDPAMNDLFAAYVFLEPVPYTARLVDSSGAVIASWPTA